MAANLPASSVELSLTAALIAVSAAVTEVMFDAVTVPSQSMLPLK